MSVGGTAPLLPLTTTTVSSSSNTQLPAGSSSSSSINPSILTIVLILSATVLLSVSLCLLLRHLNRRCLLHLSSSSSSVSPEDHPPPPAAAASSFLDSLPVFTFASVKRRSSSSEGDCAVCLSKFEGEDRLRLLPLCCHAFHVECIDTWLSSNQTCPLCRSPLFASEISDLLSRRSSGASSFRIEIGSVSRRRPDPADPSHQRQSSYSMGSSLDYVVDGEYSEVTVEKEEEEEGRSISWLREYVERLSSRAMSFRSSGRWFFTGSSRRSSDHHSHQDHDNQEEVVVVVVDDDDVIRNYDLEAATRATGDHISEMFRWFSAL